MLRNLFGAKSARKNARASAESLYGSAVDAARNAAFYSDFGVADTVDGRFEMISLHVYLLLRRLKSAGAEGKQLSQMLFDTMFDDMDRTLREMGVGDLGVGRRVKEMAKAFYGRIAAYDEGLEAGTEDTLGLALSRNVFRAEEARAPGVLALAGYVRAAVRQLDGVENGTLFAGDVAFSQPVGAGS
ncbi:MAG: ubiquinol-cytochrome C chaperone [Proteobacteria bacterium]|nr:ubiquinol-cytochrome C chaperone [Pseudomonadota bacterium]